MQVQRLGKQNATVVCHKNGVEVLFSYNTPVAVFLPESGFFKTSRKYSATTSRHINQWCPDKARAVSQDTLEFYADGHTRRVHNKITELA